MAIAGEFNYEFEELPVIRDGAAFFGMINGHAVIEYDYEGSWSVEEIVLHGARKLSYSLEDHLQAVEEGRSLPKYESASYVMDEGSPAYFSILDQIQTDCADAINERVASELGMDDLPAFDPQREWGTHNRTMQGV